MKQRGSTELINTEQLIEVGTGLAEHGPAEAGPGEPSGAGAGVQAPTDLDTALIRTLRRFIAEVSKSDQPQVPSEASQKRAHPIREQGKRAAHLLWGK
jgi:hypothetical protein